MCSPHTQGAFFIFSLGASLPPFLHLIKSLCDCTSAAPMSSVPSVKRSTILKFASEA